ncbi:bifunctional [glutamine synthetase] adenylyltransferase/[glutamine synthetase]-adenylyl-L-tyrosine phosphorylase [Bosea caraganae]|uniref:Bifunctional glutamine synthetase adenylyltransferase/adenylyl-removing enzyme n=1 Tax=Bosea caraganae TaxID=2763117 RepID=A0A370L3H2_9HYPH|nr:bifunctional [glutamine synthetase] adenylyltransferase/[glutamine synthetase]-adenylyl-L-tyrosine phosphorylase [Bosea caraganae]RDJ22977.1 bifunctional [glutamine synthetase] adenylyltransferase/[glutamine synthetase]-adenylyl-L-tyrosine phosphorylase [Bosea caraganae]RDJ28757.1 bifunctional [glutamine synthetase] adenylyltransferase/[glutamine synthetase]-adenylyl-L-tyrosine phosphorylase [Bosea caraganae]
MSGQLCERLTLAPVLPARARAEALLQRDLIERLHDEDAAKALTAHFAANPNSAALVAGILAHSPFLTQVMRFDPAGLLAALTMRPEERRDALLAEVAAQGGAGCETPDLMRALRRFRQAMALLIALADIGGVWDVETVTAALTATADMAVRLAADHALRQAADLGRITLADPENPGLGSGLVVLALGKHGAGELNYSSDIDIVVFFDPEAAEAAGVAEPSSFFVKLTQQVARIIQERTPDGYVFRVDLRLRPDPASTHVAVALPSAYSYYETVGQNWERAAMIKARPVAGDLDLGRRFIADLAPFIWRKYFDFAAIADIHAMKRQIQTVKGHETIAVAGHNVKLGRGGIREIEFFVQTQQLVFGGRRPALRGPRTLDMLAELTREGWINDKARDELGESYRFLRTIEHRLQMRADEQTQTLPAQKDDLEAFSRFCGYPSTAAFGKALTFHARRVEGHYALLFEEGPSLASEAGTLSFTGTEVDPDTLETLRKLGFRDPKAAAETVRGWHFGRRAAVTSSRAREVLTELTPALLVALGRTADPDGALAHLDNAFVRMPAAVELLTLLRSHGSLLTLFAEILGSAPRLAKVAALYPHVLDGVIDPAFTSSALDAEAVARRVRSAVGTPPSVEDGLDRLRDAARQENFLVGARLLSGVYPAQQAGQAYCAVAEACLRVAFEDTKAAFAADHGIVEGAEIAVLGLGRLGAGELTPSSDLDLILLYDRPDDAEASNGRKALDPVTWHVRFTQRLVAALTVPTRRGTLYQVDMRLRPSGNKSPVATQFKGFEAYHSGEAEIWEEMALTRARVVAGDAALAGRAEAAIRAILARKRNPAKVAAAVSQMRALIAKEKGEDDPWDLKLAAGGLTDLDFLAQFLILAYAGDCPELLVRDTASVFAAARGAGLLSAGDASALGEAHRLIGDVQLWQRFTVEEDFDLNTVPERVLRRIATAVGRPDAKVLRAELDETRAAVRAIFKRVLGSARPG